jgi:BlaI family penicillinase repressor
VSATFCRNGPKGAPNKRWLTPFSRSERGDELAYTTVLSLLQVMEQKGFVTHRRAGRAYVYVPRAERQSTIRRMARSFLEKVFDGAVDEYLVHALEAKRLSADELDQLEAMLAEARQRSTPRRPKGGRK